MRSKINLKSKLTEHIPIGEGDLKKTCDNNQV